MGLIFGILRGIPIWVYAIAAVLAWGSWQKMQATIATRKTANAELAVSKAREEALAKAVQETARIANAQGAISDETAKKLDAARADARRASTDVNRMRDAVVAAASHAQYSATSGDCSAASETARVCADMLGRSLIRVSVLADFADRAYTAGTACEQSYEAVAKGKTSASH